MAHFRAELRLDDGSTLRVAVVGPFVTLEHRPAKGGSHAMGFTTRDARNVEGALRDACVAVSLRGNGDNRRKGRPS